MSGQWDLIAPRPTMHSGRRGITHKHSTFPNEEANTLKDRCVSAIARQIERSEDTENTGSCSDPIPSSELRLPYIFYQHLL